MNQSVPSSEDGGDEECPERNGLRAFFGIGFLTGGSGSVFADDTDLFFVVAMHSLIGIGSAHDLGVASVTATLALAAAAGPASLRLFGTRWSFFKDMR